jgi:methionyl-tRNA synthetase
MRKILVTCALPYANGSVHIGHLVEHIQADIWVRFLKLQGHDVHFLCADDTHGTPIMIESRKQGITPEKLIGDAWIEHTEDFKGFQIQFSHYSSTNSPANKELCEFFFEKIKAGGHLGSKKIDQLYCEHDKMFLPDRFVKGECPKCGAKDQYGDSCDVCAATYTPADLKSPACAICGNKPVLKQSEQLLFKVNNFKSFLENWIPQHLSRDMVAKMMEWFKEDLREWDISRNAPYFGFQIPGYTDKYFYVWVDAPMGYVSTTKEYAQQGKLKFEDYWKSEDSEVYHFIGKDITYFHALFWPALLKSADFRLPTKIHVHGMLTVNGEKMSKSKGTSLKVKTYLKHLDPMYLRYYYASKLSSGVDDIDLNLEDFSQRVNSDLIGKITNLASRGAQMLSKKMDGVMSVPDEKGFALLSSLQASAPKIAEAYEKLEFSKAISEIRFLADEANRYFDEKAPWKTLESDPAGTKQVLTTTLNVFRNLAIFLKPVLPAYTQKVEKLFNEKPYSWKDLKTTLKNHKINDYEHLATRLDPVKVQAMIEESKVTETKTTPAPLHAAAAPQETSAHCSIDDFSKIDLRIGKIVSAEAIPEADKLLKLQIDLGPLGTKQIFAGIKSAYEATSLVGRLTVVVANLAPRKMKFGMSEGMVLAAGAGGKELFILSPDSGAKPGDKVK